MSATKDQAVRDLPGRRAPLVLIPVSAAAGRLRTSMRLLIVVLALLTPGVGATVAYSATVTGQIGFSRSEEAGLVVLDPALVVAARIVAGEAPDLSALEAAVRAHPELGLDEQLTAVRAAVSGLGTGTEGDPVAAVGAVQALITEAGNASNLILDPDLDSFYVMDSLVVQVPRLLVAIAAAAHPAQTDQDARVAAQAVRAGTVSGAADSLTGNVSTAVKHTADTGLAARLAGLQKVAEAAGKDAAALTADLRSATVDGAETASAAQGATVEASRALGALLDARIGDLSMKRTLTVALSFTGLLLAGWFATGVGWRTTSDIRMAADAVAGLAEGDGVAHPVPGGRDELGGLGRSVAAARARLSDQTQALADAQRNRELDLQRQMQERAEAEHAANAAAQAIISRTADDVGAQLAAVLEQADAVRSAADTIDSRVVTTETASREVRGRANDAQAIAASLGESLQDVTRMADMISGVAEQTHLLALNATIEAARAGTAGRGFAVVAGEVKELASTTGRSTVEISSTVAELGNQARQMAAAVEQIAAGIAGLDDVTAVLASVASDQRDVVGNLNSTLTSAITRVASIGEPSTAEGA